MRILRRAFLRRRILRPILTPLTFVPPSFAPIFYSS
jgi:hypothetical protein